jgi:hypothetical protein
LKGFQIFFNFNETFYTKLFKLQSFKGLFVEQKIAKNKFVLCFRKCGLQQQGKLINSYLSGPRDIPLIKLTLGQLLQQAADRFGDRTAAVFIHQDIRKTFHQVLVDVWITKRHEKREKNQNQSIYTGG